MFTSWARKSMAVAAIATGAVLFTGGMAQAADMSAAPVVEGGVDQGGMNLCGNTIANDSIVVNLNDCVNANGLAVDYDSWGHWGH